MIGFVKLGIIPHVFLMKDGTYEYIIHHYHVLQIVNFQFN